MKYSRLQYFLWLISGSEISILSECENDYNRHANIGLMILITSVFAFFTAYIAGTTFAGTHKIGVILFALVWAVLVFSIDRSMVNSIKKDPAAATQPFWSFFIPRLILAVILAFFMSIPLDHIVFPEAIKRQMDANVHSDWLKRQEDLKTGYAVSARESDLKTMAGTITNIEDELKSECPLPNYANTMASYTNCASGLPSLRADYENRKAAAARYYVQLGRIRGGNPTYLALRRARDSAWKTLSERQKECNQYQAEARKIDSDWRANKQLELNEQTSRQAKGLADLNTDKEKIKTSSEALREELAAMTGFDTKFTTLFLMPSWGVQVLKWAIFFALLVIEILPTYLKLKTPVGQYDRRMQEREDMVMNGIDARVSSEREIARQTEDHRKNKEIELNKEVINKIASIELKLAEELLADWEVLARAESKRNVNDVAQPHRVRTTATFK